MRTRQISTGWKWVGALAAVLVPSVVVALTIPNEFSPGDPIVSAQVNENFSAIAAAVNALDAEVSDLADDLGELGDKVDDLTDDLGQLSLTCTSVNSADVDIAAGATGIATVSCSQATTVTGGGCYVGTTQGAVQYLGTNASPLTNGWACRMRNTDNATRRLVAVARCCSL